ncbi:IclR family transcriptional regulator [Pseudotenacibaculum haliotis]|uniref:IclR family transcriptional regulator n=1 Tax=Pseudotenacibaculum haliotis TaxID=1862138 RepID=A0ABW5LSB3_9FLAO
MEKDVKNLNQSIIKAFTLLDAFTPDKKEWGVRELANKTGYNKSTTYRLLSTLVSLHIVYQNKNDKYSLGSKLFELGNRVSLYESLASISNEPIKNIALNIEETVLLGVLKESQVLYINKADSLNGLKISTSIGSYQPTHATATGKLLMAHASMSELQSYLKNNRFQSFTKNTITESKALLNELQTIKKQGYSLDLEEFELGLICIAIPVFNKKGEVIAGVSASGPSSRFKMENVEKYISILQKGVSRIEQSL